MSNPVYEKLLDDLASGELTELQREVYKLLKANPAGLTRGELVKCLRGYRPSDISGNSDDRKIRKAIEALRRRLFPIVSTSTRAGYRLGTSRADVLKMIHELQARKERIQDQIEAAAKFYEIPEYREPINATQARLA